MTHQHGYSPKYSCLPIEQIELGKEYAITIAPDDNSQYWNETKDHQSRINMFVQNSSIQMHKVLQPLKYKLYLEVSAGSRLHWHGRIKFTTPEALKRFYVTQIRKLQNIGTYEIDTMNKDWEKYEQKQYNIWKEVITSEDKISKIALMDVPTEVVYKKIPLRD